MINLKSCFRMNYHRDIEGHLKEKQESYIHMLIWYRVYNRVINYKIGEYV